MIRDELSSHRLARADAQIGRCPECGTWRWVPLRLAADVVAARVLGHLDPIPCHHLTAPTERSYAA